MLLPAFHALGKFGLSDELPEMKYLLDFRFDKDTPDAVIRWFDLATASHEQVLTLQDLIQRALAENKTHVCFERFVVGMMYDSLLHYDYHHGSVISHNLETIRNEFSRLYPRSNTRQNGCRLLILDRAENRFIVDVGRLLRLSAKTIRGNWSMVVEMFEHIPLSHQYKIIAETDILITVSGTGSHWALFLPEGAVSIVIKSHNRNVNDGICGHANHVKCFSVNSRRIEGDTAHEDLRDKGWIKKKDWPVVLNYAEMKNALLGARQHLQSDCLAIDPVSED